MNRQRTRSITTVPWNLAGTALIVSALSLFGASGLSAQSRAEELRQRREAKSSTLDAPSRGGLENGLYKFENQRLLERLAKGYKSFHPKLGGLATGSGFALGVEYLSDELAEEGVVFRIAGQASPVGYQRYELQLALPELFDNHFLFDFTARHRNYPQEDFFGIGAESQRENRSNYRLEDTLVQITGGVRPVEWLSVGARGGILNTNTGAGTDTRYPSIEKVFDDSRAPSLDQQPDYLQLGAFVDIDYRDQPLNPRSGGQYKLEWTSFDDRASNLFGFKRVDAEIRQYLPFFNLRRVIAFRAKTSLVDSKAGNRVSFFMQPTLGGSDDLRGFREFRFRDQNLFLMNLEYRWEAFSGLDMAIFGDAGKVFARRADLGFGDLRTAVGFGARFNSVNGVFFRLDTGFSNEGTRIFWKFGHVF